MCQFDAQGPARHSQPAGGLGLVALGQLDGLGKQLPFAVCNQPGMGVVMFDARAVVRVRGPHGAPRCSFGVDPSHPNSLVARGPASRQDTPHIAGTVAAITESDPEGTE